MLQSALSFNVHEKYFGMVEEKMIVQSGDTQPAFESDEHPEINFIFKQDRVAHNHRFAVRALGEGCPGAESHKRRHFPPIDRDRNIVARGSLSYKRLLFHSACALNQLADQFVPCSK
jgi:hypothetical protein